MREEWRRGERERGEERKERGGEEMRGMEMGRMGGEAGERER